MPRLYKYVGPTEVMETVEDTQSGITVNYADDLVRWATENCECSDGLTTLTFVVLPNSVLRVAPRRSEHVACALGGAVLTAGEITVRLKPELEVLKASNQSTGYCPEPSSWRVAKEVLDALAVKAPLELTFACTFRKCPRCGERNLVKEEWYVCDLCGEGLPCEWNFE